MKYTPSLTFIKNKNNNMEVYKIKIIETIIQKLSLLAQGFAKHKKNDESKTFLKRQLNYKKLLENTLAQSLPLT